MNNTKFIDLVNITDIELCDMINNLGAQITEWFTLEDAHNLLSTVLQRNLLRVCDIVGEANGIKPRKILDSMIREMIMVFELENNEIH